MSGVHVGSSESRFLPGFYIEPRAAELLIANGWQPPTPTDPAGSFFMPERPTMTKHIERLTRAEADLAVRHLTGRYYDKYEVDNGPRFDDFVAKLSWQIGGRKTVDFRDYLEEALTDLDGMDAVYGANLPTEHRDQHESDFNESVNKALDAANIPGLWIRRYTEPVTT